ncbi:MAG TPA: heme-binding protein [Nitrospira sp.]
MLSMNRWQSHIWLSVHGLIIFAACVVGLPSGAVAAEDLPREAVLPVSLAATAVRVAVDQCAKDGYRVSAAVVDRAGLLRAFLRGDGAGPHTVESSQKKAYTAASMRVSTGNVADLIAKTPAVQGLQYMNDKILFLAGGLPIDIGGDVVGGIGVGGAPGGHLDAACAQAGLDSMGAAPKFQGPK